MDSEDITKLADSIKQTLTLDESPTKYEVPVTHTEIQIVEFTVFCEAVSTFSDDNNDPTLHRRNCHIIVHLPSITSAQFTSLETVDISLIIDKFPEGSIGLKGGGSSNATFLLVKCWADLNFADIVKTIDENSTQHQLPSFLVTTIYESTRMIRISCTTRICSYGNSIGEKVQEFEGVQVDLNRFLFQTLQTPLCDYLVNFIGKLSSLDIASMNSVLENFTVIQVLSNQDTKETLLCLAYVFEACPPESDTGAAFTMYRLTCSDSS